MGPELFRFKGKPIREGTSQTLWEELRRELKTKYLVDNTKIPRIVAIRLTYKHFAKAMKKLRASPHIKDQTKTEWREEDVEASACAFFSDEEQT